MFARLNSIKALKTLIKLAAVALTSPATVAVAGSLYPANPLTRVVVSAAALVLVEGCLLLGWQMLDRHGKDATMTQRWLYAGLMWVAYFSLFGIALYHREGAAGFAFRATLGVTLLYASVEAGLVAGIKRDRQADRDIRKDRRVRQYARKLARQQAMADLDLDARMRQLDREAREKLYTLQKGQETKRQVEQIQSGNRKPVEMAKSTPTLGSLDKANRQRKLSKQVALDKTLQILTEDPGTRPSEIAAQIGRSRQTVYDYLKELEATGRVQRNGRGVVVTG